MAELLSRKIITRSTWESSSSQQELGNIVRVHSSADFDGEHIDLEDYADGSTCCELVKPNADERFCAISLECPAEFSVKTLVIIVDSSVIEVFGPSVGYIQTSRGQLLDEFEGTTIHGHTIDLVSRVLPAIDLQVFPLKLQSTITFFGFHIYATRTHPITATISNVGKLPSTISPEQILPMHVLFQKIDSLKLDLLSMEERLKAHIDKEVAALRAEFLQRLEKYCHTAEVNAKPD
ncbi:uncharacterized protein LOC129583922 [Paramacrobiotus metropolitanus]|uniref:uncharacterized protein LOC129583922 n=1 Tax=Paramacrobiotus metropolitanus TaxID=2943436 RepID=UPI002445D3B0|nr:uncharacterized protein LOC129583922 [Paramacrobiotus metropolitanus]